MTARDADVLPATDAEAAARPWFGHPRGLSTLFLTEMWERFTYYGMRAILVLFMVDAVATGGFGLDDRTASAIYGLYIGGSYLFCVIGGWIADRIWGAQRAVWWGGVLILLGNCLLVPGEARFFFVGLLVIVLGVGLLKPNISAIVASLYPEGGSRRDAGFSIFYMGINVGAMLGSLLIPLVAARFGWSAGFALPAAGMLIGLLQFRLTRQHLGNAGAEAAGIMTHGRGSWMPVLAGMALVVLMVVLVIIGIVRLDPVLLNRGASGVILAFAFLYFMYLGFFAGLDAVERRRLVVMVLLFVACAMFWAGFEQAGASLNLFAERHTERELWGWVMPAGVLQAVNPVFIITFAPVFAALWVWLGQRNLDPSSPAKFGFGLLLMGAGFFVMYLASRYVIAGEQVLPTWLIMTYLLHTFGELCLSPVGLSSFTKLAPARFVGQSLGLWFMATALGGNIAGQISGGFDANNLATMPGQFLFVFWWGTLAGIVMLLLTPWSRRLMGGVR